MHTKTPARISVSERALFQRINRKLKTNSEKLCKTRGDQYPWAYYTLDTHDNKLSRIQPIIEDSKAGLEAFARKLGVLQNHEQVKS